MLPSRKMIKGRICCLFNYAPHYNFPLWKEMSQHLPVDFFSGDKLPHNESIRKMRTDLIPGYITEYHAHFIGPFEFSSGWCRLAMHKRYSTFIITPNYLAINQYVFLVLCRLLGKTVYAWTHGLISSRSSKRLLCISRFYFSFVKGILLYGDKARNNMIEYGFSPSKLHTIYNSLDYGLSYSLRFVVIDDLFYPTAVGNRNPVLVFIGRLTHVKKLDLIIDLVLKLKDRSVTVNCVFIGDGPERSHLEAKAAFLDGIYFLGPIYDEALIGKYLANASLCISPGNVGLTAIHCLSFGLPVATNDNFDTQMPEHEAICDWVTGFFFKEDDIDDLTSKTVAWLQSKDREEVRNACYKVIDTKYNPRNQVRIMQSVLSDY